MSLNSGDSELILLWQNGNEKAFEVLYKKYAVWATGIAAGKTGSKDVAQEIVQDVFLSLFLKKETADQIVNLPAFLHTMIRNKILDRYRRNVLFQKYELYSVNAYSQQDNSTMQLVETWDLKHQLAIQIEKLPLKCKNIYKLSRDKHLPNKKIAFLLNISENTVEQHMRKALKILRTSVLYSSSLF